LPTLREIAAEFGMRSANGVVGHIRALARHGVVQRLDKQQAVNYRLQGVRLRLDDETTPPPDECLRPADRLSCRNAATAVQDS
jgi:SOS-response transcriptional repressor LexA